MSYLQVKSKKSWPTPTPPLQRNRKEVEGDIDKIRDSTTKVTKNTYTKLHGKLQEMIDTKEENHGEGPKKMG
jgi:hypothetical protein